VHVLLLPVDPAIGSCHRDRADRIASFPSAFSGGRVRESQSGRLFLTPPTKSCRRLFGLFLRPKKPVGRCKILKDTRPGSRMMTFGSLVRNPVVYSAFRDPFEPCRSGSTKGMSVDGGGRPCCTSWFSSVIMCPYWIVKSLAYPTSISRYRWTSLSFGAYPSTVASPPPPVCCQESQSRTPDPVDLTACVLFTAVDRSAHNLLEYCVRQRQNGPSLMDSTLLKTVLRVLPPAR